jgi:hypothetical protein
MSVAYLDMTMHQLSNILANVSQKPSERGCNDALDSIRRMLEEYQRAGGKVNLTDYRETRRVW